jgi:hypothetical protein
VAGADLLGNGANGYLFSDWEFDMTIDFDKPLQTKSGEPVEIITTNGRVAYPVKGYVGNSENILAWNKEGEAAGFRGDHACNLMNVPEKRYAYLNVHPIHTDSFPTKEMADNWASSDRLSCLKIELIEGQYDD